MGLALGVCEKKKRWCLLASQTGVILLATPLLFLSSYLISVLPLIGWDGREKKIRRQCLCRFFFPPLFCRLLHRKRYWKPFMVQFLLFHLLICLEQLCRERTLDTDKHVLNAGCLYAGLPLKYKSGVLLEQCCDIHATNTAFFLHNQQRFTVSRKKEGRKKHGCKGHRRLCFLHFHFFQCQFSSLTKSVI